jgi:hypothetical protein
MMRCLPGVAGYLSKGTEVGGVKLKSIAAKPYCVLKSPKYASSPTTANTAAAAAAAFGCIGLLLPQRCSSYYKLVLLYSYARQGSQIKRQVRGKGYLKIVV